MKNFYKYLMNGKHLSEEGIIEEMNKTERLWLTEELLNQETDFSFFREFKNLNHLEIDSVFDTKRLMSIPFDKLVNLKELIIRNSYVSNLLSLLPNSIEKLEIRDYDENFIQKQVIGDEIGRFQNLKTLNLESSNIIEISTKIGELKILQFLSINVQIDLPKEIKELKIDTLMIRIDYDNPNISFLGKIITSLKNLKYLIFFYQNSEGVPEWIFNLRNLEGLIIGIRAIKEIPKEIQNLTNLRELGLMDCKVTTIPKFITKLKNLESLVFQETELNNIPEYIKDLPNLKFLNIICCLNLLFDEEKMKDIKEMLPNVKILGI